MIERIITKIFSSRNLAQFTHWSVTGQGSYATHIALCEFYENIIDLLDTFVESYQGKNGLISAEKNGREDIIKVLKEDMTLLEKARKTVTKDNGALENLYDAITDQYMKTLYKLENLS